MFDPIYNRVLERWRDMLTNPTALQEFLEVEDGWMFAAAGP